MLWVAEDSNGKIVGYVLAKMEEDVGDGPVHGKSFSENIALCIYFRYLHFLKINCLLIFILSIFWNRSHNIISGFAHTS